MKHLKKIMSLILTAIMVIAMCVPVMADDTVNYYTVTINDKATAAKPYEAYQIFKGTIHKDANNKNILSDIEWGRNISEAGKTALLSFGKTSGEQPYANVAELAKSLNDSNAENFANAVAGYITGAPYENKNGNGDVTSTILIPKTDAGYYFIKNKDNSAQNGQAYTKFILQVSADTGFTPKTDAPSIEKKVKNDDEPDSAYRDANNVAIGDIINYKISSEIPDMSDYTQYYFIVNDTMSKGLDYYTDATHNMTVKVGETTLTPTANIDDEGTTYKLTTTKNTDGTTKLEIVFSKFIQYKAYTNKAIEITYSAKLNNDAIIGNNGNPNNVDLTYSNNPNEHGTGTNKPGDNDNVTGTTPKDWVITYTTELGIFKYGDTENDKLQGVQFVMTGFKNNDSTKFEEHYTISADGTYYKLTDGKYTTQIPTEFTKKYYESTTDKYKLTTRYGSFTSSVDTYSHAITTDVNGLAKFNTIAAGTYEIIELKTKDGYNMLPHPLKVEVTFTNPSTVTAGNEEGTWTITVTDSTGNKTLDTTSNYVKNLLKIQNKSGSNLPETGGIGTTIFYVVGVVLMLGAGVLLITKRRMSAKH